MEQWAKSLTVKMTSSLNFHVGAGGNAVSQMLASRRFLSNGGFFLTLSLNTIKYGLFYRFACSLLDNSDVNAHLLQHNLETNESFNTNHMRRILKSQAVYADVITFLIIETAIYENLLRVPFNYESKSATSNIGAYIPNATNHSLRGVCGNLLGYYLCHEVTQKRNLHSHAKLWHGFDWNYIYQIANNVDLNKDIGEYLDSIISSELSSTRVFDLPVSERPKPEDPAPIWFSDNIPDAPNNHKLPFPKDVESDNLEDFWVIYENYGYVVQFHGNHNFSCWKDNNKMCRFKLPAHAWNQLTGFIEIVLDSHATKLEPPKIHILERVSDPPLPDEDKFFEDFEKDLRIILFNSIKRSNDSSLIRDPSLLFLSETIEALPNDDKGRNNGLMSPCNAVILVIALCHNNLQLLTRLAGGLDQYLAKYISKGIGKLTNILSLFYAAILMHGKSVADDVDTNSNRDALYILNKTLNNLTRKVNYPNTLMLAYLLGMEEYMSSHSYIYIKIYMMQYRK